MAYPMAYPTAYPTAHNIWLLEDMEAKDGTATTNVIGLLDQPED